MKLKKLQYKGLPLEAEGLPMFKETDPVTPVLVNTDKTGIFRMDNKEDVEEYNRIMDMILADKARMLDRDRRFKEDSDTWVIFLEWAEKSYRFGE